ncbi:MAG: chlorite dismutase family protein [Sorangiineae bacterium]|nr:chlorite dismutase family protein [Polyangiaceae bacterium]MEB2325020.1 chlorite dismutase family protein [Sorangiineae bacterium]
MPSPNESVSVDVTERGADRDGQPQVMDRRLFMQLLVFDVARDRSPESALAALRAALERRGAAAVIYEDVSNPRGLGLLTWSEEPAHFVTTVRAAVNDPEASGLTLNPAFTMFGRSYSSGHEPNLEQALLERPRVTATNPAWPWAIWYPLRRTGSFERLEGRDKGAILREHAVIGRAYGAADLAHDVRLVSHGLDARDNEFIIGLIGKSLHPLSHVVQTMRRTRQTSEFIAQMGPFFVGRAAWQSTGGG